MVTLSNWTTTVEWYVVRWCKNGHQRDFCFKKIGCSAENMLTILGSMVDRLGGYIDSPRPFNVKEHLHFKQANSCKFWKSLWGKGLKTWFGIGNHLTLIAYFTTYERRRKLAYLSYILSFFANHVKVDPI